MKKIFIAVVYEEKGKYFPYGIPIKSGQNIKPILEQTNTKAWHLCESRKQMDDMIQNWREQYKANGTYLYKGF